MSPKERLDPAFAAVAAYFSMLAEPARLKILHAICDGERTVTQIVAETGVSQTNASRHLGLMHRHGLVIRRRDGNHVYYGPPDDTMRELCNTVCDRIARAMDDQPPLRRQLRELSRV